METNNKMSDIKQHTDIAGRLKSWVDKNKKAAFFAALLPSDSTRRRIMRMLYRKIFPEQTASEETAGAPPDGCHSIYYTHNPSPQMVEADAAYTFSVAVNYLNYLDEMGVRSLTGARVLEIGPGANFGTVFILKALGAAELHVADRFLSHFDSEYHPAVYRILKDMTKEAYPQANLDIFDQCIAARAHTVEGLHCHACGLENLGAIATSSIDIVLSVAALEHLSDPPAAFRNLARVSAPGAIHSHHVDFRQHPTGSPNPLGFLLLPDEELTAFTTANHFGCGNGWRPREYLELFRLCGFDVLRESPTLFAEDDYMDAFMPKLLGSSSRFRSFSKQELRVIGSHFMVKKACAE
jgi:SAM-dependent methyltransferase